MSKLTKVRDTHLIVDEIHAVMTLYPGCANDADFIVSTTAEALGRDEADVRKVWMDHFHIGGVC